MERYSNTDSTAANPHSTSVFGTTTSDTSPARNTVWSAATKYRGGRTRVSSRIGAGIELDVTAGYGDAAIDVPEPLRQAIRLLVAHWYENRGLIASGTTTSVLPSTVAALLAPYRVLSL